ncbi:[FeFe] hydrogenase H-cluster radical SAM maturase HydG [candidate division WOR-1 bacterium RIFOXYA12_FULL_43_27]|uniref:[FeFe] hydrogenase H-cluster radical SAM maturase HydG n=1 Tax=candidate division WOR-1 bacterium RIFOXYC2_FULL_46_14 TaxID=1802587 RepID=A0A1F4U7C6_UNCSA|nr:MAG: [FeFe] hydrogenase H-cluster radical SAM maturase HydG [candidate division WOR-1 bacterium RIFOXYA12_FULL_43_27]OGC19274.1 MAG: [FeFe] hydrogenase H-cluster radical SAM maturase HydG [candidate division WOR-1 bacterium RIFOXYB2_FULL_46_45]OGC30263.1 MAG: [FeFe] hydrogenase H-cluster radical SAM maturase HydG [candidate division WOR-1 bacterium RIFOXYA2_FULL_46_56]OGC40864.1 MAG: [FeFe] hydrogenase H-cluster radical SAM maturase HydG [candidate division WOR-1 bacterium RIFOXYC2_FULL_46_14
MESFIDEGKIQGLLKGVKASRDRGIEVREIIQKSLSKQRLDLSEVAALLNTEDPELIAEIFAGAKKLKELVYGNRIVLFAPLYIGNDCVNDCQYCAFRVSNKEARRRTLSDAELKKEIETLESKGHKRLILVYGEHPKYDADFIAKTVKITYATKKDRGEIRRVNINAPPLDVEGFKTVKEAGIGTYQIFQETYHQETYKKYHPRGKKADYLWRLYGLDRAQEAGIDDVGIGALFGLYDWKFEVMGLVSHAIHLEERWNVGPHTISFPRVQPAQGVKIDPKYLVSDEEFKRLVAILRLAVPYTGMILTARENPQIRKEVIDLGCSQIDAGSRTELGGYTDSQADQESDRQQFKLGDTRSLDEVMRGLLEDGYIPSFCTSCYRLGRTGEHFMEFAIPGFIHEYCTPNALLTLKEYLEDYSLPETKKAGNKAIQGVLDKMKNPKVKQIVIDKLARIEKGERDLYC